MRLLLSLALCAGIAATSSAQTGKEEPAARVAVAEVLERAVSAGHTFVGAVTPSRESLVGSAVGGRVAELFVNDGDEVTMVEQEDPPRLVGQPIAQLLTETISIQIAAARAQLELRQHELAEMEAGSRPEEIAQAKAKLAGAKALMEYAHSRFGRVKSLYDEGKSASKEEFEESLSASLAAEQDYLAAAAAHALSVAGPRREQIEQARARLVAAREEVRRLEDQRGKHTIRTRFHGFVVAKHTEVGAWISEGDLVAEIVQLDPIEIRVSVPENYISHVKIGATARVRLEARPAHVIVGTVARIVPRADSRSRTFPVVVRLPNPKVKGSHVFKAGMLAHVTLGVGQEEKAILVPKDSLVLNVRDTTVFLVDMEAPKPRALEVRVELGVADDSLIQVTRPSGLELEQQRVWDRLRAGQLVVVRGNERLRPGQLLDVVATPKR